MKDHLWNMQQAEKEAEKAYHLDEVPIGCVIVNEEQKIIATGHNLKESQNDPCAHAEIIAIRKAASALQNWRLSKCTLYVTLEPCIMCLGAIIQARMKLLVYGTYDEKYGLKNLWEPIIETYNHNLPVIGGLRHYENSKRLSEFFKLKRKHH